MRPAELEAKVLGIIDRVRMTHTVEDSHVELKADWIDPKKAARRIAAHCNAAGGDPVLWIIGLDEQNGVVGAKEEELADWWAKVRAEFDQQEPSLIRNLAVPTGEQSVMALLISSERAPFVVRNPTGSGPSHEVPWREGNATRTARREDLVRILVPAARIPELELLDARVESTSSDGTDWQLIINVAMYVIARVPTLLIAHRCRVDVDPDPVGFRDAFYERGFSGSTTEGVSVTRHDAMLSRPAHLQLNVGGAMSGIGPDLAASITLRVELAVADSASRPVVTVPLMQVRQTKQSVLYVRPDRDRVEY